MVGRSKRLERMAPASTAFGHAVSCLSSVQMRCAGPGQGHLLPVEPSTLSEPEFGMRHHKTSSVVGLCICANSNL